MTSQEDCAKELIKLDFPEKLISSPDNCNLLSYCKRHEMRFLRKSDAILVHKKFYNHFKISECIKMRNKLSLKGHLYEKENIKLPLENINLLKSKTDEKVFILLSSPSRDLNIHIINELKNYTYDIYFIHPYYLDKSTFIEDRINNPKEGLDHIFQEERKNPDHIIAEDLRLPLRNINYAFTNASESQIQNMNEKIYQDTGLAYVFKKCVF